MSKKVLKPSKSFSAKMKKSLRTVLIENAKGSGKNRKTLADLIQCPSDLTPSQQRTAVRRAKQGIRPPWLSPQQWAWNVVNPRSIRLNINKAVK